MSDAIITNPPGVSVYRRNYNSPIAKWEFAGLSPITKGRSPAVDSSWNFELPGYTSRERATFPSGPMNVTLQENGKAPSRMVPVEFENKGSMQSRPVTLWGFAGFEALPAVRVGTYWIDKFEVTNAEFKRFLDQEVTKAAVLETRIPKGRTRAALGRCEGNSTSKAESGDSSGR